MEERLKLKDILGYITYDKICLYYNADDEGFKDVYKGSTVKVPADLLNTRIDIIGAKEKNVLDIQLNADDIPEERKCS